ncbi:MAG: hypothetical protein ABI045_00865 [Flavobacteriales bacterium]
MDRLISSDSGGGKYQYKYEPPPSRVVPQQEKASFIIISVRPAQTHLRGTAQVRKSSRIEVIDLKTSLS